MKRTMIVLLFSLLWFSTSASKCADVSCWNGGRCVELDEDDYICKCLPGFSGVHCEIDRKLGEDCSRFFCNDGFCHMKDGFPKCECPVHASGMHCDQPLTLNCLDRSLCDQRGQNGVCDPECNNPECAFDFGDCEGKAPDAIAAIFTLNGAELSRQKQRYLNMLSNGIGTQLEIWEDGNGVEGIYGYDPELRKTYDVGLEGNFSSFKVIFIASKDVKDFDVATAQKRIVDIAQIYHLPIPAAVVQGPMGRPSSRHDFVYFIVGVLLLAALASTAACRKARTPSSYQKSPKELLPLSQKGVTDISTTVSAWLGLAASEQLLSDMAVSKDEESVRMRIRELSSLNARNPAGLTAIALSIDRGFVKFLKDLLIQGADPNIADDRGNTPLHRAVMSGRTVMVQTLISSGRIESIDALNLDKDTPLMMYAKFVHDQQMGNLLLQSGATLKSGHEFQNIALHFAAQSGNLQAISVFAKSDQFQVNAQDSHLRTPLMIAAEYGNRDTCQELISLGADKEIVDDMQKTAVMWARECGYEDLAVYLMQAICNQQRRARDDQTSGNIKNARRTALQEVNPNPTSQQTVGHTTVIDTNPYGEYFSSSQSADDDYAPFVSPYLQPSHVYQAEIVPPPVHTIPKAPTFQKQQNTPTFSTDQYHSDYGMPQENNYYCASPV